MTYQGILRRCQQFFFPRRMALHVSGHARPPQFLRLVVFFSLILFFNFQAMLPHEYWALGDGVYPCKQSFPM
jgi:hypothetical protein